MDSQNQTPLHVVFEEVSDCFSKNLQKLITIDSINEKAIKQWATDWLQISNPRKKPNGGWDWAELSRAYYHKKFKYSQQRRIDIAVYVKQQLCGLALGGIEKNNHYIFIDYIEGAPVDHPLKGHILDIVLTVTRRYATILNVKELRLNDPVEGLVTHYESIGFETVYGDKPYCYIKLTHENALI